MHPYEEYALQLPVGKWEPMWEMRMFFRNVRLGIEVWSIHSPYLWG